MNKMIKQLIAGITPETRELILRDLRESIGELPQGGSFDAEDKEVFEVWSVVVEVLEEPG